MKKTLTLLTTINLVVISPLTSVGCLGNSNLLNSATSSETVYIDSKGVQNKTTALEFTDIDAVTIEKLGYDENGNSVYNLKNVKQMPETLPSQITSLELMFNGNQSEDIKNIDTWDTSNITNMVSTFEASEFKGDISKWNLDNVKTTSAMFKNSNFSHSINEWNVSNVTDMSSMFFGSKFSSTLEKWDFSNVTDMSSMFENSLFRNSLPSLEKSNLKNMSRMFYASQWKGEGINNWDVSNVTDMSYLFSKTFWYPDLSNWNVSNVINMEGMFSESYYNDYNVAGINNWDVSTVVNMKKMFYHSHVSNADISNWNVSNVTNMSSMFEYAPYNKELSKWSDKILKVVDASSMFKESVYFNQDLSSWEFSENCVLTDFATDALDEWVNHDPSWLPKNFS